MRWWDVRAPGYGSVLVKAECRPEAIIEACNRLNCGEDFVGTILMVGVEGEEFADLPCGWNMLKKMFPLLWLAPWFDGRFHAAKEVD